MNDKLAALLDIVINALDMYLNSVARIDMVEALVKKSAKHLIVFVLLLTIILLSIWGSVLALVFFYLLTFNLSMIQTLLIILGVNLLALVALSLWFTRLKSHIASVRQSSIRMLSAYIFKAVNQARHKN